MNMREDAAPQWSTDAVVESFRSEIRARFEQHNAAYREEEARDLEEALAKRPDYRGQPGFEVQDSPLWSMYQQCRITSEANSVAITLPAFSHSHFARILQMFDHTTAAWTKPIVSAVIGEDGEPRVLIEILLVATWDDELDADWRNKGHHRPLVMVELHDDELREVIASLPDHAQDARKLRDRLQRALAEAL